MTSIKSIVFQPIGQPYGDRIGIFIREPVAQARLVAGHGIDGDAKAGHHPNRQLNLLSQAWLDGVSKRGFKIGPGAFGEQLILEGLDFTELRTGDQLMLGSEACIEITKPRTGCSRLELAQGQSIEPLGGEVGILAKVVVGGQIQVGDPVLVLTKAPALGAAPSASASSASPDPASES